LGNGKARPFSKSRKETLPSSVSPSYGRVGLGGKTKRESRISECAMNNGVVKAACHS